jgi:microcystin degradation protein MlrC
MQQSQRVAVGSILTECNQFGGKLIEHDEFARSQLARGQEVMSISGGAVGGMLHTLQENDAEIIPLVVASAYPGGPIAQDCYAQLKADLLADLRNALPVDGVLLAMHGAAVTTEIDDVEGDLLEAVRELVGADVPVVGTLDLHANVTAQMMHFADGLVAWETYPHVDPFTTGVRGARLLLGTLDGAYKPAMAMAKVPILTSAINASTVGEGPFADVMRLAKSFEKLPGILSTSAFHAHATLDVPEMGGGSLVITDNDEERAAQLADEIARMMWDKRFALEPDTLTPAEAVKQGQGISGGPVILVECGDCVGGGAAGDSVATLPALTNLEEGFAIVPVVDPEAAAVCHAAGEGSTVTVALGHKIDPQWGSPLTLTGVVKTLSDGRFQYTGGIWADEWAEMGPAAVLECGSAHILITTYGTYEFQDEQFRAVDMDIEGAKFIVAKNPMNYRQTYGDIAKAEFILDTAGATPPTLKHFTYHKVPRPYFPIATEIPNFAPTILRGSQ